MNGAALVRRVAGMGPRLAEIAAVIAIAWAVAGWFAPAGGHGGAEDGGQEGALLAASPDAPDAAPPDLARMLAAHLFGEPEKAKPAPSPAPSPRPAPPARLDARLLGTVVAGEHSAAVLKLAREPAERVFFLGEEIVPGVRLAEVHADAVIIERGGRRERLALEKAKSAGMPAAIAPPPRPGVRPPSLPGRPIRRIDRPVSRGLIERGIRDFPKLLSQARVVPHFVDGKADGFVISSIVPGSLYDQVGLRNGDIIRKVNGQRVTSAQQAMAMYQALEKATSIDLEVLRAGQALQLHYDIR